jgi:hypothetical protein
MGTDSLVTLQLNKCYIVLPLAVSVYFLAVGTSGPRFPYWAQ